MPLVYITGPSGSGKSTVRNELIMRGYETYDTDEDGMSAWYNNQTLEPVERPAEKDRTPDWYEKHDYRLSDMSVVLAQRYDNLFWIYPHAHPPVR
ncbi:MAG TPA: hypothetical protein VJ836_07605 [Candidatus Saccharimonadales bacterium]|nr:hypothetical protein [Candidatus Saccharimonadales bacterium]